jgi:ABC-type dipeptide/oligopeptide/nickel transport system ATPase subunit
MQNNPPLLSIRELSCAYVKRSYGFFGRKEIKPVLDRVNLETGRGEIFGLVGVSGCGKSTLARCILGLIPYKGEITIDGIEQKKVSDSFLGRSSDSAARLEMARKVQAVFQDSGGSLNPMMRIGTIVEEPLVIHRLGTKKERLRRVDEMLLRVGLDPSYKTRRVNELSSGQKQRVSIGRALMLEPKLLIADEAISALDVSVGAQILNLFNELHESLSLGILFISHNLEAVHYLCDRAARIEDGKLTIINREI